MSPETLRLQSIDKSFGEVTVLRSVTLDVHPGELVAVVGPSGSGKTTLGRIVAGFEHPDAGTVEVAGREVAGPNTWVPPERRRVGIVPQDGALFPHLDVAGNVGAGLGRDRDRDRRIDECLELVGLSAFRTARPHELSGGQQQRVALARALAPAPSLIVLDEPFSALDAALRAHLRADVASTLAAAGSTALLITHDQDEALAMAQRIAVLLAGELHQVAPPHEAYGSPSTLDVARFLGRVIEVPGQLDGERVHTALGTLPAVGSLNGGPARDVVATIRPEQLHFRDGGRPATVTTVEYLGHDAVVELRLDDGTVAAARWGAVTGVSGERGPLPRPGDRVGIDVLGTALVFERPQTKTAS